MSQLAAAVLAAGASTRMGAPKAGLTIRGETFLARVTSVIRDAALSPIWVATSTEDAKYSAWANLAGIELLVNAAAPTAGPLSSIRMAIVHVFNHSVDIDGLLVWPVDHPAVLPATVESIKSAFFRSPGSIVVPVAGGERGHPVVFPRRVFEELLGTPDLVGARAVVRADPGRVIQVPVDDAGVLENIDTPESYQAMLVRLGEIA